MIHCNACGRELDGNEATCPSCGNRIAPSVRDTQRRISTITGPEITQPGWRNRSRSVLFITAISTITAILYFLPYYTADLGTEVVRSNFIGVALNLIRAGTITPEYIFIAAATALTILLLITAAIRSYISNTISRAALPAFILSFFYTALIFLIGIAVMDFDPTLNPNLSFSIAPAPYFTAILSLVGFFGSMFLLVLQRQNRDDPPYDTPG